MPIDWFKDCIKPITDTAEMMAQGITRSGKEVSPVDEVKSEDVASPDTEGEITRILWYRRGCGDYATAELPSIVTSIVEYIISKGKTLEDGLMMFVKMMETYPDWGEEGQLPLGFCTGGRRVEHGDHLTVEFAIQGTDETGWHTYKQEYVLTDQGLVRVMNIVGG
jgi:hypothetical protein